MSSFQSLQVLLINRLSYMNNAFTMRCGIGLNYKRGLPYE